jgi:hypothetical protein
MSSSLYERARHEPLADVAWNEAYARAWIERIADDADARFSSERLWPPHPLDQDGDVRGEPSTTPYFGAAGVIWALDALARAGFAKRRRDWSALIPPLAERNAREVERMGWGAESLLMGRSGVALLDYRLAPDEARAERVAESVARNADHPSNELMWGVPGTLHAALAMHQATGEHRWIDLFAAGAASLRASFHRQADARCRLWTQQLYGDADRLLGAAHGFAGGASAIVRGIALLDDASRCAWTDDIVETLRRTVRRDGRFANWPPEFRRAEPGKMLVHWCHGAPGMIACVAALRDERLDAILAAAGELVWSAGPLAKGPGLCHGTAGNGFAFLKLYRRSGDARWLERARAFAMHAIAQSDDHAKRYRERRYSLWTGDPGVAVYVAACIEASDGLPMLDPDARAAAR